MKITFQMQAIVTKITVHFSLWISACPASHTENHVTKESHILNVPCVIIIKIIECTFITKNLNLIYSTAPYGCHLNISSLKIPQLYFAIPWSWTHPRSSCGVTREAPHPTLKTEITAVSNYLGNITLASKY